MKSISRGDAEENRNPIPSPAHAHAFHHHPRTLLPTAARKPLARGGGDAGFRVSVSRLERAHHRRVLRAERLGAHPRSRKSASAESSTTTHRSASTSDRRSSAGSQSCAQETYAAIIEADRLSRTRRSGHGNAIAQAYNHIILPLANARDQRTQVRWGIRDFEHRFGRKPEGMWLPETAVDVASLEALAAEGIAFTILEPSRQRARTVANGGAAGSIRRCRTSASFPRGARSRSSSTTDRSRAPSPSSASSRAARTSPIASLGAFSDTRPHTQLVNIATDGETYGHHHRFGDMALAYALRSSKSKSLATLTNYAEFLERHPADARGRDRRADVVELRPRRRALAQRLRLQHRRRTGMESAVARAAARGARLAARRSSGDLRARRQARAARSLGGARRVHRRHPRSQRTDDRRRFILRSMRSTVARTITSSSCWRCSATPCSCTRAAAGSSTRSPASRRVQVLHYAARVDPARRAPRRDVPRSSSSSTASSPRAATCRRQGQRTPDLRARRHPGASRSLARRRALRRALALRRLRRRRARLLLRRHAPRLRDPQEPAARVWRSARSKSRSRITRETAAFEFAACTSAKRS